MDTAINNNSYQSSFVKLENYYGPLDLLLQLVRKQEMDIFKIDISQITNQYMKYLKEVKTPDLENAGDFIRMASWLIYIKSRSLLPKEEQEEEEPSAEELKHNLSLLLLTYQKFQKIGALLYSRTLLGRDCWTGYRTLNLKNPIKTKIEIDKETGILQLMQSYHQSLISRKAKKNYKIHNPIPHFLHRLRQITEVFTMGARLKFNHLVLINKSKYSRLLSFLSVLELSKAGFISLLQKHTFSNIEIFVKKAVTEESIKEFSHEEEQKAEGEFERQQALL